MCDLSQRYALCFDAVVTFRGIVNQQQAAKRLQDIMRICVQASVATDRRVLTCTHEMYADGTSDFEAIVPIADSIDVRMPYFCKKEFHLDNCIRVSTNDPNPQQIQQEIALLYDYVKAMKLNPLSTGYTLMEQSLDGASWITEYYLPVDG